MTVIIRKWYWVALFIWMFTGLPIIYIGIGFAGSELFTFGGLISVFTPDLESLSAFLSWLSAFTIAFLPIILLPLAIKFTRVELQQQEAGSLGQDT
jgi:hypothetical protein